MLGWINRPTALALRLLSSHGILRLLVMGDEVSWIGNQSRAPHILPAEAGRMQKVLINRMQSSLEDLIGFYGSISQQLLDRTRDFVITAPEDANRSNLEADASTIALSRSLLQALSAATSSTLSYSCAIQSIIIRFQGTIIKRYSSNVDNVNNHSVIIDDLRMLLREIGEIASREGRNFQQQLMIINEQLAQSEAKARQQ
jgi:hypothetical protein